MKITQLGHASLYIETAGPRILMDPVLIDPHQEGKLAIFPDREVHWENLPEFDLLVLSHHHLDHFDVDTLSRLPRDVQVLIPDSPLLENAFRRLGYPSIRRITPNVWIELDEARLLFTPSAVSFPEVGLLIQDRDGTFWNQVDSILTLKHVDLVMAIAGKVDLLLSTWQPMLETAFLDNQPFQFPIDAYAQLLANVGRIQPAALAPGANGFQYLGQSAWLNHIVFPQSRERFLRDVVAMLPELRDKAFAFDPGDALELKDASVRHLPRDSRFVSSAPRDPFVLEFRPSTAQRPLNASAAPLTAADESLVENFCADTLPRYISERPILYTSHREWGVVYQLEVAFADRSEYWSVDFAASSPVWRCEHNPCANLFCGVTASGLASVLNGRHTWEGLYLSGEYYQHHRIYGVWRKGVVLPVNLDVSNPLIDMFPADEVFERMIANALEDASGDHEPVSPIPGSMSGAGNQRIATA